MKRGTGAELFVSQRGGGASARAVRRADGAPELATEEMYFYVVLNIIINVCMKTALHFPNVPIWEHAPNS
jgi:hypothetical protein